MYQPDWAITSTKCINNAVGLFGLRFTWPDKLIYQQLFSDHGYEDFGWVPQFLADSLFNNPEIQGATIRAGGPRIDNHPCNSFAGRIGWAIDDSTYSSRQTIDITGCFHPGACPKVHSPVLATTSLEKTNCESLTTPARVLQSVA